MSSSNNTKISITNPSKVVILSQLYGKSIDNISGAEINLGYFSGDNQVNIELTSIVDSTFKKKMLLGSFSYAGEGASKSLLSKLPKPTEGPIVDRDLIKIEITDSLGFTMVIENLIVIALEGSYFTFVSSPISKITLPSTVKR